MTDGQKGAPIKSECLTNIITKPLENEAVVINLEQLPDEQAKELAMDSVIEYITPLWINERTTLEGIIRAGGYPYQHRVILQRKLEFYDSVLKSKDSTREYFEKKLEEVELILSAVIKFGDRSFPVWNDPETAELFCASLLIPGKSNPGENIVVDPAQRVLRNKVLRQINTLSSLPKEMLNYLISRSPTLKIPSDIELALVDFSMEEINKILTGTRKTPLNIKFSKIFNKREIKDDLKRKDKTRRELQEKHKEVRDIIIQVLSQQKDYSYRQLQNIFFTEVFTLSVKKGWTEFKIFPLYYEDDDLNINDIIFGYIPILNMPEELREKIQNFDLKFTSPEE